MKKEDLIKKLERISLPKIELTSHKQRLKARLIDNYFQARRKQEAMLVFRKFAFTSLSLLILAFFSFYLVLPEYTLAKAGKIVLADPQVKDLIERGNVLKEIRVIDNKGYALISPAEEGGLIEVNQEKFAGVLVEVSIKAEKVSQIRRISSSVFFDEKEEERVREIAEESPEIEKNIPKEAEVLRIEGVPSELRLIQKGDAVEVLPKKQKARIIYELDEKKWQGQVDLLEENVENVEALEEKNLKNSTTVEEESPSSSLKPSSNPSLTPRF